MSSLYHSQGQLDQTMLRSMSDISSSMRVGRQTLTDRAEVGNIYMISNRIQA